MPSSSSARERRGDSLRRLLERERPDTGPLTLTTVCLKRKFDLSSSYVLLYVLGVRSENEVVFVVLLKKEAAQYTCLLIGQIV